VPSRVLCRSFPESRSAVSKINVCLTLRLKGFTCMEFGIYEMRPGNVVRDYRIVVVETVINEDS
jgi:hypothetical protein